MRATIATDITQVDGVESISKKKRFICECVFIPVYVLVAFNFRKCSAMVSLSVITAAITLTVKLVAKSNFTINTFKTKWWVINWERLHCTVNMALAIQVVEIRGPVHCSAIDLCLSTFIYKLCHFHKTELSVKKTNLII